MNQTVALGLRSPGFQSRLCPRFPDAPGSAVRPRCALDSSCQCRTGTLYDSRCLLETEGLSRFQMTDTNVLGRAVLPAKPQGGDPASNSCTRHGVPGHAQGPSMVMALTNTSAHYADETAKASRGRLLARGLPACQGQAGHWIPEDASSQLPGDLHSLAHPHPGTRAVCQPSESPECFENKRLHLPSDSLRTLSREKRLANKRFLLEAAQGFRGERRCHVEADRLPWSQRQVGSALPSLATAHLTSCCPWEAPASSRA